jgi:hypothetical protein
VFRRIEIIQHVSPEDYEATIQSIRRTTGAPESEIHREFPRAWKMGLLGTAGSPAVDAWIDMPSPRRVAIPRSCRFYFTEAGWRRYGRPAVAACQQFGFDYRVIAVKEKSVDVVYRDEVQVAARPRKKKRA